MPKFCYGTASTVTNYPSTGKFDVKMLWNPNVLNELNVAETTVADEASTNTLLCDDAFADTLPGTSEFTDNSSTATEFVVGWST